MAKTCFYCGRELAPGQRCSCRGTSSSAGSTAVTSGSSGSSASASPDSATHSSTAGTYDAGSASGYSSDSTHSSAAPDYSSCSADPSHYSKKASKKTKQVWNHAGSASSGAGTSDGKFSFARFIDQVRTKFPSISKVMRPVMNYIWHPVSTIQNRPQKVSVPKVLIINTIFATFTSLMVLFTNRTNSPFLGMLISLLFGKTDLFSAHPFIAFGTISVILWFSVLLLAMCFFVTSRFANRRLSYLRALDTVTMSSIYLCFADVLIFFSVLLGTQGAFTLIFVALVIMGITHFVSLKQDLMLTDNAAFNMLAASYLMFYCLAQLGIIIIIRIANSF